MTPPCSTFSRAVWANEQGPFPVRSHIYPRGFPWNTLACFQKAELGNLLGDFSFEAMRRQARHTGHVGMMEQPEDLGETTGDRMPGHRPASMWQFPQFFKALEEGMRTVVFAQMDFGTEAVKPTRLLLHMEGEVHEAMVEGIPRLDADGWYEGPLPKREGKALIGRDNGVFRTAAAAAWPEALCRWAAETIVAAYQRYSEKGSGNNNNNKGSNDKGRDAKRKREEGSEADPTAKKVHQGVDPMNPIYPGGMGPPRSCTWKGYEAPFHDGGGLPSPGRWPKGKRKYPMTKEWRCVRQKVMEVAIQRSGGEKGLEMEFFRMTKGGDHFHLVKDAELLEEIRQIFIRELHLGEGKNVVPPGQPFYLKLMQGILDSAGDCDGAFLDRACTGFPLGVLEDLPRTPGVFEQQVKWALEDDPTMQWDMAKNNYASASLHEEHLRAHLEAEVEAGLMDKMSGAEFEKRYGENRAIAALAVLVEDEASGKKRVIHDGTNRIGVNNRIRCQDKVRMPGPREKRRILEELAESGELVMALVGDFEKAHRRFLYQEIERGFLACRITEEEDVIYVNRVGTFGIGSTPYWWARLSGALIRLAHYVVGPDLFVEMLLYADDLEVIAPSRPGRLGAVLVFLVMSAVGAPFKWKKQRGGWITEWVGITTDYKKLSMGLSERRAQWLCEWMRSVEERKEVTDVEFAAGLGRLSFASLALPWERPLLGPLFSWSSAVWGTKGLLRVPWVVLVVMRWITRKLEQGQRLEEVKRRPLETPGGWKIWTDAKATEEDAWIGGWLQVGSDTKKCPWFSEKVEAWMAPWLRVKKGNPKRVIAALELLATLVAIKLWLKDDGGRLQMHTEAFTDNKGNEFILKKGMSTKFPIALLVIEVGETLRKRSATADLKWVRRDDNQRADDLTNEEFKEFCEERRVRVTRENCKWEVLDELLPESEQLFREVQAFKEKKRSEKAKKNEEKKKGQKFFGRWNS